MSNLIEHAKREMQLAGLYDKDSDYDGALGTAVEELIKVFSEQGHSGFSAMRTLQIFNRVANFQHLMPITDDPNDWQNVGDMGSSGYNTWQCKRNSALFSEDGGKTYHDVNDKTKEIKVSKPMKKEPKP